MDNTNATEVSNAAFVPSWLATPQLNRSVAAIGDSRGQLCPNTDGGAKFGTPSPLTGEQSLRQAGGSQISAMPARIRVARYGSAISTLTVLDSVQLSKPRTGYHASSGTG